MSLLSLSPERIDLWFVFYDELHDSPLLHEYRQLLTEDERAQELRFYFVRDQVRYLVTRALVRTTLSRYSAIRPEDWRFTRNAFGRPEILNRQDQAHPISFNISHTAGLIVLSVTGRNALGVDTENTQARKACLDIADSFFSPGEVKALYGLPQGLQHDRFFDYWTLKESYIKAKGKGLSIPLDQFSFAFPGGRSVSISFSPELNDDPLQWRFWQFRPDVDYLVAICAQRSEGLSQRLDMKRIVPLKMESPLCYTLLRHSDWT